MSAEAQQEAAGRRWRVDIALMSIQRIARYTVNHDSCLVTLRFSLAVSGAAYAAATEDIDLDVGRVWTC